MAGTCECNTISTNDETIPQAQETPKKIFLSTELLPVKLEDPLINIFDLIGESQLKRQGRATAKNMRCGDCRVYCDYVPIF
jgi:hypothetical protein